MHSWITAISQGGWEGRGWRIPDSALEPPCWARSVCSPRATQANSVSKPYQLLPSGLPSPSPDQQQNVNWVQCWVVMNCGNEYSKSGISSHLLPIDFMLRWEPCLLGCKIKMCHSDTERKVFLKCQPTMWPRTEPEIFPLTHGKPRINRDLNSLSSNDVSRDSREAARKHSISDPLLKFLGLVGVRLYRQGKYWNLF